MATKTKATKRAKSVSKKDIFKQRAIPNPLAPAEAQHHVYKRKNSKEVLCSTDSRGFATSKNRDPREIVVDASEGFIPLWEKDSILRWRFDPNAVNYFMYPSEALKMIRDYFAEAIYRWDYACPVKFSEKHDAWDFEITIQQDNCSVNGCTLARAFFPDGGRHQLVLFPKLFEETEKEIIETLIHELGHIFGLRHFFAELSESDYPSVKFGRQRPFTIMNYGKKSVLTKADKEDLKELYDKVWSGELTHINGTRIVTFYPYHTLGGVGLDDGANSFSQLRAFKFRNGV